MKIQPSVRKNKNNFVGYVKVFNNKRFLWSQSSKVKRLTHNDAWLDACELSADIQLRNRTGE